MELTVADHMQKVLKPNFAAAWEEIGDSNELEDTYGLSSMKSVEGLPSLSRKFILLQRDLLRVHVVV